MAVARAKIKDTGGQSHTRSAQRHCCRLCGSALWLFSPEWPEHTHRLLDSKASWVEVNVRPGDKQFGGYPEESIAQWHERLGLSR